MPRLVAALVASILIAGDAAAQPRTAGIALDAMFGGGKHSESSGTRWFNDDESPMARLALTVTLSNAHVRPFFSIDRSSFASNGDRISLCSPAPNGGCRQYFPGLAGYSVGGGARIALSRRLDFGVGAGVGDMDGRSAYAEVDFAFAIASHVRLVANDRHIAVWQSSGYLLWRPLILGLRLQ